MGKIFLMFLIVVLFPNVIWGRSLQYNTTLNREAQEAERFIATGEYLNGLEALKKAQVKYQEREDEEGILLCMERIAYLFREMGEYSQALEFLNEAYPLGVRLHGDAAELDVEFGEVYFFSGDSEKASHYYQKALDTLKGFVFKTKYDWFPTRKEISEQVRKSRAFIHAHDELGFKYYFEKDYEQAIHHLNEAEIMIQTVLSVIKFWDPGSVPDLMEGVGYARCALASVYARQKDFTKAFALFDEAKEAFKKSRKFYGLLVTQALRFEAETLSPELELSSEKIEEIEQFIDKSKSLGAETIVWRTYYGLGNALLQRKQSAEAKNYLALAIDTLEVTRARFRDDAMKQIFSSSVQDVYHTMINLLHELGEDEEAFNYLERAKSRSFLEMLAGRSFHAKAAVDSNLLAREKEIQRNIDEIQARLRATSKNVDDEVLELKQALHRELNEVLEKIREQDPAYASTLAVIAMPTKKISERLGTKTAVVSYFLDETRTLIFVLDKNRLTTVESKATSHVLTKLVSEYRQAIASHNEGMVKDAGRELGLLLLDPIKELCSGIERVIVVPSEALHYLPFAALPTAPNHCLIEDYTISTLPSASSMFFIDREVTQDMHKCLAIGNPVRGDKEPELKFAAQEVKEVATFFSEPAVRTGASATETLFKEAKFSGVAVVHLAAHGRYDPKNPLSSAVLLTGDEENDGDLQALEIFSLKMNPRVVVLSACQSGISQVSLGNEIQGLNRAFLYAGAGSVLASLWNVSDESTYKLMKHFYQNLSRGNAASALRQAQLELIKEYPQPYYWAAFYLTGSALD